MSREFAIELAQLMRKHKVDLAARVKPNTEYAYVIFQSRESGNIFKDMRRSHVTPYDIMTQCLGVPSDVANRMGKGGDA